jgi:hypothetical protein
MSRTITCHESQFTGKGHLLTHTKELLLELPVGAVITPESHPNSYAFLQAFIKRHPLYESKIGVESVGLTIRRNFSAGKDARMLYVKRVDETKEQFVLKECASAHVSVKKYDPLRKLKAACRSAIKEHVDNYRHEHRAMVMCDHCRKPCTVKDAHVDHVKRFEDIFAEFCELETELPLYFDTNEGKRVVFKERDKEFEERWYKFHHLHARYQMVHKRCNTSDLNKGTSLRKNRVKKEELAVSSD